MSAEMKSKNVSAERLIAAVREFPSIWDSRSPEYKKKKFKKQAWAAVARDTVEGWSEFDSKEQHSALLILVRRWNNIRDYYYKALKAERLATLRGVPYNRRVYMYADALRFIRPELERNFLPKHSSDPELKMEFEEEQEEAEEEDGDFNDITFVDTFDNYDATPSRSQSTEYEGNVTKYSENQEDHDLMFLKSLLPDMKKLGDDEKFQFKYAIMTAYKNIIEKRKPKETQDSD